MRSDETSEDQQGGGNGKSAKIWVILAGAAALVAVGVFMMISNGNKQMTSKGDRTGISTQETAAKAAQQRETERLRIDAESRDLAKLKEEAKLQQQAATEALNQARKEEAIRKQEALTLAAQQRDAKHLQEEAEAIKQAKLADAARKRQAPDPFMANDQAKPKNGDSGSPGSAPGYSTHLEFPKSEIIDRFNLGNPNNLGTALAKANTMQTKSKELARTGQEQTRTQDSISPLTGVYSSAEHIRRNGVDNIKKAEELQQDAVAIRSGVNDIKRYLQSKANEPGRTKIHEIASKDGRKMQVQIIGSVDQGIVVKKIDGEFLQVNMNQLSDKSAQYVNGIINP